MKKDKLEAIYTSYINGQHKQMKDQIKSYGVRLWHYDIIEYQAMDYLPQGKALAMISRFNS